MLLCLDGVRESGENRWKTTFDLGWCGEESWGGGRRREGEATTVLADRTSAVSKPVEMEVRDVWRGGGSAGDC